MKALLPVLFVAACTTQGVHSSPETGSAGSNSPASANCDRPEGPLVSYSLVSEFNTLAVGAWIHCSGPTIFQNETLGLEFDADGTYYLLADNGAGGFTKLNGFDKQGTWDGSQEGNSVQWNIHPTPNSGTGGTAEFEQDPRRFSMYVLYNEDPSVYAIAAP